MPSLFVVKCIQSINTHPINNQVGVCDHSPGHMGSSLFIFDTGPTSNYAFQKKKESGSCKWCRNSKTIEIKSYTLKEDWTIVKLPINIAHWET